MSCHLSSSDIETYGSLDELSKTFVQMETIVCRKQPINEAINHYRKLIWQSGEAISNINFSIYLRTSCFTRRGEYFQGSYREVEMAE